MLSAVITSQRSQPAVLLAEQLAHQRLVRPGPLVLRTALLKTPTRAADRDRTVSRRSKPSSRAALMGEQPNPWAPPLPFRRRPPQSNYPSGTVPEPDNGPRLDNQSDQSGISTMTPPELASRFHSLPPILHKSHRSPIPNYSKGPGVFPSCCA